jgi:bifunctional DNA-binding transcriptional regulator/antitoxin component of YhaV-PrlF toxin-antitoxin module
VSSIAAVKAASDTKGGNPVGGYGNRGYALLMAQQVKLTRRRGYTRVSAKNQVTIPREALARAGLRAGDRLRAEVRGPGKLVLVRVDDPVERYAGSLTGAFGPGYVDELRREWR